MYKLSIKVDTDDIMDNLKQELELCMNDLVLEMRSDAVEKAYEEKESDDEESDDLHTRTGTLGNTMVAKTEWQGTKLVGKVSTHVEYAEYVEHGTGIHADEHRGGARTRYLGKIDGLVGKKYIDKKGKERTYSGWVWINGQKPKHYMLRTVNEYRPKVKDYFKIK